MRNLTGLNSEIYLYNGYSTKVKELSLPYYLPIAGWEIVGYILFSKLFTLCDVETGSSRIWTRVTVSISYNGNQYTSSAYEGVVFYKTNLSKCRF